MARHTSTWKSVERRVAETLGGRRLGPGADRADVRSDWLCVEVKQRRALPEWLKAGLAQAVRYAGAGQLPLEVLHEEGKHDSLVIMRLSDFSAWFGELPALPEVAHNGP